MLFIPLWKANTPTSLKRCGDVTCLLPQISSQDHELYLCQSLQVSRPLPVPTGTTPSNNNATCMSWPILNISPLLWNPHEKRAKANIGSCMSWPIGQCTRTTCPSLPLQHPEPHFLGSWMFCFLVSSRWSYLDLMLSSLYTCFLKPAVTSCASILQVHELIATKFGSGK